MTSPATAHGADPGDVKAQWKGVFEQEQLLLLARAAGRRPAGAGETASYPTGLCLSGGGIRSASVSIGVLQTLAGAGMLQHIDYLSSVSGGGYTAATLALRNAQASKRGKTDPDADFPLKPGGDALARLRHAANYLAPGGFANYATGFFVVARSLVLNVFIWLFLGALGFTLLMALFYERQHPCMLLPWADDETPCGAAAVFDWLLVIAAGLGALLAALVVGFSLSGWRLMTDPAGTDGVADDGRDEIAPLVRLMFAVGAVGLAAPLVPLADTASWPTVAALTALVLIALWALTPMLGPRWPGGVAAAVLVLTIVAMLITAVLTDSVPGLRGDSRTKVALLAAAALAVLLTRLPHGQAAQPSPKYARRRAQERVSSRLLVALVLCLAIALVPIVPTFAQALPDLLTGKPVSVDIAKPATPSLPLVLVYLVSGAAALIGYWRTRLQGVLGTGTATLLVVGSLLLFYATAVLAYWIARDLFAAAQAWLGGGSPDLTTAQRLSIAGVVAALLLAVVVNINDVSLGRYYRDRLTEAFMPDEEIPVDDLDRPATEADRFRLTEIAEFVAPPPPPKPPRSWLGRLVRRLLRPLSRARRAATQAPTADLLGPYPLINTYVVRRRSPNAITRRRGGDSFLISPLYCGSSETGYKPTRDVIHGELTLATAMAISGAAANPGGGLAGRGVTTNFLVVAAMSLLSLRLGYRFRWDWETPVRQWLNPFGNHVFPAFSEILAELIGRRSHCNVFVDLSDGGHFDNIGVYELVRRRCGLIIVCDGGQDPTASYESFVSALTLIGEDFGTRAEFDMRVRSAGRLEASGPQNVVARSVDDEYPREADFARRGYFLATLRYPPLGAATRVPMAETGPKTAQVIYLKSAMVRGLSLASRGYKGANPDFPYEPTSDQFFSPEQFEAYREVGQEIARQMLSETGLAGLFADGRPPLDRLRRNPRFSARP